MLPLDTSRFDPLGLPHFPYEFVRISRRCFAFVEPRGLSNVGVVEGEKGLILVDSTIHPYYTNEMLRRLEADLAKPVLYLINTHFHRDHTFGNVAVRPRCGIVAHSRCAHYFESCGPQLLEQHRSFYDGRPFALSRPEIVFDEDAWSVSDFDLEVQVRLVGGHTHDSCMVWVPTERVLFASDTVFNHVAPYVGHWSCLDNFGSVIDWISALNAVLRLSASTIVPGHGMLAQDSEVMRLLQFFSHYAEKVHRGIESGHSLREIWNAIYRSRDFRWSDADVETYLYLTMSLHEELARATEAGRTVDPEAPTSGPSISY